jgi:hypothetical protein
MDKDVNYFFLCLLSIHNSLAKSLFNSFAHSCLDYLFFLCLIFCILYICWILIHCQMNSWQRYLYILSLSPYLVIVSFAVQKLFHLMQYHLSVLVIISWNTEDLKDLAYVYILKHSVYALLWYIHRFRFDIKGFVLFGIDFCTRWTAWIRFQSSTGEYSFNTIY